MNIFYFVYCGIVMISKLSISVKFVEKRNVQLVSESALYHFLHTLKISGGSHESIGDTRKQ
eukprot:3496442-Ditylum_brightwellii.AAC.1